MGYRENPDALRRLVEPDCVHRDVYTDPEVFQLEMERLWSRTWIYVGHASQVPEAGDYLTADIAAKPVIMMRQADGGIRVLMNRCAHKGTKVLGGVSGNTGKAIRCPYHAWTYRLDGSLAMIQGDNFFFPFVYSVPTLWAKSPGALLVPRGIAEADGLTIVK